VYIYYTINIITKHIKSNRSKRIIVFTDLTNVEKKNAQYVDIQIDYVVLKCSIINL